jgi:hypothetical protein
MLELGRAKGYTLVCHTGNMVFVRSDLAAALALSPAELFPEILFDQQWLHHADRWLRARARVRKLIRPAGP